MYVQLQEVQHLNLTVTKQVTIQLLHNNNNGQQYLTGWLVS